MDIAHEVKNLKVKLIQWRRDFHKYPETVWTEYRTAALIAEELDRLGFEVSVGPEACQSESRMGVPAEEILKTHEQRAIAEEANPGWIKKMEGGYTGVIGVLRSDKPGSTIALRFDIDAIQIEESNALQHLPVREGFRSCHDGVMHACGHDGHTAIGLGIASMLASHRKELTGEVRLLFQPAEEGVQGAKSMVDRGWLDGVDYFFSGHIGFQSRTLGEIIAATKGFLATTKIDVTYEGKAAHAGEKPHEGKNALLAAATAAIQLHAISRHADGGTRVNVGVLQAGTARNIIPNKAVMEVETRGETTSLNDYMTAEAIRILEAAAQMYEVKYKWEITGIAPEGTSSEELIGLIEQESKKVEGITSVIPQKNFGASEDVPFMMNRVQEQGGKASYLQFGTTIIEGHHKDRFDFDEEVLVIGVELLTRVIISLNLLPAL